MKFKIFKKNVNKKKSSWMCKTDQKTRNYIMPFRATNCPTEAEKIK